MKKYLAILGAILLIAAACGSDPTPVPPTDTPVPPTATTAPGQTPQPTSTPAPTQAPTEPPVEQKEVVLGMVLPLSGPAADWGVGVLRGAELAVEDINAKGGVTTGNTNYTFKIVSYDSKLDPANALTLMRRVIEQDGAKHAFILHENTYNAVKDYVDEQGATLLRWGWGHISNDYPMQFRVVYPPESYADIFFQQAKNVFPDISQLAMIGPDSGAYRYANSVSAAAAPNYGLEVVATEYFPEGTADVTPIMQRVLAAEPDVIILNTDPGSGYRTMKAGQDLGYDGVYIHTAPLELDNIDAAAPGIKNVILSNPLESAWGQPLVDFKARYLAKYGGDFSWIAADMSHTMETIIDGIRQAGTDDPAAVAEALKTKTITSTIWGDVSGWGEQIGEFNGYLAHGVPVSVYSDGELNFLGFAKP